VLFFHQVIVSNAHVCRLEEAVDFACAFDHSANLYENWSTSADERLAAIATCSYDHHQGARAKQLSNDLRAELHEHDESLRRMSNELRGVGDELQGFAAEQRQLPEASVNDNYEPVELRSRYARLCERHAHLKRELDRLASDQQRAAALADDFEHDCRAADDWLAHMLKQIEATMANPSANTDEQLRLVEEMNERLAREGGCVKQARQSGDKLINVLPDDQQFDGKKKDIGDRCDEMDKR